MTIHLVLWYLLRDTIAVILELTSLSKAPLRSGAFAGLICSGASLLTALFYLIYKLAFWQYFVPGPAPSVIGVAFIQVFFIGMVRDYTGSIHTLVSRRLR